MNAEIISVGDEITAGQILDTNAQWLSLRLADLGIRVLFHTTVGDELGAQADVFRIAIARADVVVATGGLGPTADDLTRDALAAATGRPLRLDEEALAHVRGIFARRKMEMPEQNRLQATFPEGSRIIDNPHGTAPGIEMLISRSEIERKSTGTCRLFALPGVPAEMREMWDASVSRSLCAAGAGKRIILHKKINCFGGGESRIEEMLPDMIRRGRKPTVGITASGATIALRISADGESEAECLAAMEPTIKTIRDCLGDLVFGQDDETLQDVVVGMLRRRGETLATAEWGTAGLVTRWLSEADGSGYSDTKGGFLGGVAGRSEGLLAALDMPQNLLKKDAGEELVREMAIACRRRLASNYGLAVGPFPVSCSEAEPASEPPQVFTALASPQGVAVKSLPYAWHPALRETFFAKQVLNFARLALLGRSG